MSPINQPRDRGPIRPRALLSAPRGATIEHGGDNASAETQADDPLLRPSVTREDQAATIPDTAGLDDHRTVAMVAPEDHAAAISDGVTLDLEPALAEERPTVVDPLSAVANDSLGYGVIAGELEETVVDRADDSRAARQYTIAGYEILGELGRGAMGIVYKARQRGLKRIVALKMIIAGSHSGTAELARFRSEAVAVAELQHPGIVQLYEVGEDRGHPFFSLEFVDGPNLAKKVSGVPQPPRESARLTRALAEAIELAHSRGIIHRDLKPANVLLTTRGEPKISDFGLVKRLEDDAGNTQSGSILGTPSYMAPEQAEGRINEDVMAMLLKEMVPMAERIEGQGVTSFAVAASHQSLGDLLRRFARGEEARRQYRQGADLLERIIAEQPDNDQARGNLGVIFLLLGETALDLDGDARLAHDEFHHSWSIQDEIALHPRSNSYTAVDNHRILSGIELKLGMAELALGHPAEAVEWCKKAVGDRIAWSDAQPQNVSARSYLSESELWLGIALSHHGVWPPAHDHFEQAIQICEALSRQFPNDSTFHSDLAEVFGNYADALVRFGKLDDAEKAYNRSLREALLALARSPDDAGRRQIAADAHDRLGSCLARRGQNTAADEHLKATLAVRAELAELEPGNLPRQAAHAPGACANAQAQRGPAQSR